MPLGEERQTSENSCPHRKATKQSWPLWGDVCHSLLYAVSVIPLAVCYVAAFCLFYMAGHDRFFRFLAAPGRMALTNYITQSLIGIFLFYGIGLGWGTRLGLVHIELIAVGVFFLQVILSHVWLRCFRFGPLEWLWRMLTYGKWFSILAKDDSNLSNYRKS